jgi:uncharacterized membrane protein
MNLTNNKSNLFKFFEAKWQLIAVVLFFGIIYSLVSIVNHYNYRTYALDLGLFNNTLFDYRNLQWNPTTLLLPNFNINNTLGDHFSLYMMFFAPFSYIFGSYTLLIFQILSILFGGIGIYKLILQWSNNPKIAFFALIHFYSIWGIFSALSFDYHDNVVAAMLVPWIVLNIEKKQLGKAAIFFVLVLFAKENLALWLAFICIGLAIHYRKERKTVFFLFLGTIISFLYFVVVIKYVIPYFAGNSNQYIHFDFTALGSNMKEVIINVISHPQKAFTLLFEEHKGDPALFGIKSELHFIVILSGGFALLLYPKFLIMLLPIYGQKLFNDLEVRWGISYQYSIEFVPILTMALFYWIIKLKDVKIKQKYLISILSIVITITATASSLDSRVSRWFSPELSRFYQKIHYKTNYNSRKISAALKLVPKDSKVSAQSQLVPRLALRDTIYFFPYIADAEYIVLLPIDSTNTYPIPLCEYRTDIENIKKSKDWKTLFNDNEILIFKKNEHP